jgi:hypothetical protein
MKALKPEAKLGVVVHGPEVVDSGSALKLIDYLKRFGRVTAVLGGTMGRLALIDAGLEDVIAVSPDRRPSRSLRSIQSYSDILLLLAQSKTRETGLTFGSSVAANADVHKPLIQIDCGGRFVSSLAGDGEEMAGIIAEDLGLDLLKGRASHDRVVHEGETIKRTITGASPGELITVNGTVVAKALSDRVELEARNGRIVNVNGAKPKPGGIEKLTSVDLGKAIIRSGNIRRTQARRVRAIECKGDLAVIINHCAEDAFEIAKDACIAVTVGDDTTAIAGEVLSRLSIPVIGIVDGDLDRLGGATAMPKGSMMISVMPGYDDVVGGLVKEEIFKGEDRTQISTSDLINRVMEIAGEHLLHIKTM